MHPTRRIRLFVDRNPLVGPILWLSCIQFFIVQVVVAAAWQPGYSWRLNAISDLGAINCGPFDDRYVCSPSHGLMNASFILLGFCMTIGSVLLYQELRKSRVGFTLMAVAGIGAMLVGLFPEDTIYWAHITGADLAFLLSNIALIVFGFSLRLPRWFRLYTTVSGTVGIVALYLFLSHHRFFLELGGMERMVAYPMVIWLIVFGFFMSKRRNRQTAKNS